MNDLDLKDQIEALHAHLQALYNLTFEADKDVSHLLEPILKQAADLRANVNAKPVQADMDIVQIGSLK